MLPLGAALARADTTLTGWLSVAWGDPEPGVEAPAVLELRLTTEDGVELPLLVLDEVLAEGGGLLELQNRRVTVELIGDLAGLEGALPAGIEAVAGAIRLAPADEKGVAPAAPIPAPGANPWVSLPCKFSDIANEPRDQAYFQDQYGDAPGELNHFWKSESYNIINIDGSMAEDWLDLPSTRATYVPNENACTNPMLQNADLGRLFDDCVAAHDASVNFAPFVGINLLFNANLDGCAWGGSRFRTLDGVTKSWPVTWEPPFGYTNNSVFEHENGHGFGLPHSNNWDADNFPYDNEWDYMSGGAFFPGANPYGSWGTGGMAWHKELLGWLAPGEIQVVSGGVETVDLDPLGAATAANKRLVKIPTGAGRWWTVEARQKAGTYEIGLPDTAVIISDVLESGRGEPIWVYDDAGPPADNNGNEESMWKVGETFSDPANGITVEVLETIASGGFRVRVTTTGCAADAFEPDDGAGQASILTPGVTQSHGICPVGDEDWSTFTVVQESEAVLATSGPSGDTRMWLLDADLNQLDFDDDGAAGLFSRIDRTCGVDSLAPGTYFVQIDEFGDDEEIQSYALDLTTALCPCPASLTLSNQTLDGTQIHQATMTLTLGPGLDVDGTSIAARAGGMLKIVDDTRIAGTFAGGNSPSCPP